MLVLPSAYFYASFLPPPAIFWAVSPSSLNRSSPLHAGENYMQAQDPRVNLKHSFIIVFFFKTFNVE